MRFICMKLRGPHIINPAGKTDKRQKYVLTEKLERTNIKEMYNIDGKISKRKKL